MAHPTVHGGARGRAYSQQHAPHSPLSALLASLGSAVALLLGACAPPVQDDARTPGPALYVLNGLDRTVTRLHGVGRQVAEPSISVRGVPLQVVAAPGDAFLVMATDERGREPRLLHFRRNGSRWVALILPLDPGAQDVVLAGDGRRYAIAAYRMSPPVADAPVPEGQGPAADPCHLALLDLVAGTVAARSTLAPATCDASDSIRSLASAQAAGGAVAYVGLWRWPQTAAPAAGSGRVVKVEMSAVGITAQHVLPLEGAPERLVLGTAAERPGDRLYAVEAVPGPQHADWALARGEEYAPPRAWHLLGVDPDALLPETVLSLRQPPTAVALSPDGRRAYALIARDGRPPTSDLREVDLVSGSARRLTTLAGLSLSITASDDHIFATRSNADHVWVLDAHTGRVVRTVAVGRHPMGLALGIA
ncbi:MAG: YncE family protein [Chloroflexota bacterium]